MFLEHLKNVNEKETFMKLAYWVSTVDGSLGLPEIKMLDIFERETGIKELKKINGPPCLQEACEAFPDELSKKIIFSNLLAIGAAEEFEKSCQTKAVERIREALGISPGEAQSIRDWMKMVRGQCVSQYYFD